jgi:hypothetical protein
MDEYLFFCRGAGVKKTDFLDEKDDCPAHPFFVFWIPYSLVSKGDGTSRALYATAREIPRVPSCWGRGKHRRAGYSAAAKYGNRRLRDISRRRVTHETRYTRRKKYYQEGFWGKKLWS